MAGLAAAVGAPVREDGPGRYAVAAASDPALVARLSGWLAERGLALTELQSGGGGLEAVFLRLTTAGGGTPGDPPHGPPGGPPDGAGRTGRTGRAR